MQRSLDEDHSAKFDCVATPAPEKGPAQRCGCAQRASYNGTLNRPESSGKMMLFWCILRRLERCFNSTRRWEFHLHRGGLPGLVLPV